MHIQSKGGGVIALFGFGALLVGGFLMYGQTPPKGWILPLAIGLILGVICWGLGRTDKRLKKAFDSWYDFTVWFQDCDDQFMLIPIYVWGWIISVLSVAGFAYMAFRIWVLPFPPR